MTRSSNLYKYWCQFKIISSKHEYSTNATSSFTITHLIGLIGLISTIGPGVPSPSGKRSTQSCSRPYQQKRANLALDSHIRTSMKPIGSKAKQQGAAGEPVRRPPAEDCRVGASRRARARGARQGPGRWAQSARGGPPQGPDPAWPQEAGRATRTTTSGTSDAPHAARGLWPARPPSPRILRHLHLREWFLWPPGAAEDPPTRTADAATPRAALPTRAAALGFSSHASSELHHLSTDGKIHWYIQWERVCVCVFK